MANLSFARPRFDDKESKALPIRSILHKVREKVMKVIRHEKGMKTAA
jgi:hypothetical protein